MAQDIGYTCFDRLITIPADHSVVGADQQLPVISDYEAINLSVRQPFLDRGKSPFTHIKEACISGTHPDGAVARLRHGYDQIVSRRRRRWNLFKPTFAVNESAIQTHRKQSLAVRSQTYRRNTGVRSVE